MKKRMTSTPHDAVFKRFLRQPETATDFLTLYLPEAIRQRCDFSTLRLQSASFIDEDLRAWYSDVLWSVQTTCGTGYVYVVICGEVIVSACVDHCREKHAKPYGTRLWAGQAVSARLVGK